MSPAIASFAYGESPTAAFDAVRRQAQPGAEPEPIAAGTLCLLGHLGGEPVARCTIHLVDGLQGAPGRSGLIGHYETLDPVTGVTVLHAARERLDREGVKRVLGPMNGNTWGRYRLALLAEAGEPPGLAGPGDGFPGEPRNPADYPAHFEGAGFGVAAHYESRIDTDLGEPASLERVHEGLAAAGLSAATLDPARFDAELEAIFDLSLRAFVDNLYYSPIPFAPFRAAYERLRPILDPELVFLVRDARGGLAAFLFGFTDAGRLIVKTVAVAPERRGIGLGHAILDLARDAARRKGHHAVIHALMHVDNFSMKMSARHASRVFRRYALFSREGG